MITKQTITLIIEFDEDDENLGSPFLEGIEEYVKDYDLGITNVRRKDLIDTEGEKNCGNCYWSGKNDCPCPCENSLALKLNWKPKQFERSCENCGNGKGSQTCYGCIALYDWQPQKVKEGI